MWFGFRLALVGFTLLALAIGLSVSEFWTTTPLTRDGNDTQQECVPAAASPVEFERLVDSGLGAF